MWNNIQNGWRKDVVFIIIVIMFLGLFLSRALLSCGLIAFVFVSLFHKNTRAQLRQFFSSPLLWGMSLLFLLVLISGLWSEDKKEWAALLRIKLPLLFLPLAFSSPPPLSKRNWQILGFLFLALLTVATAWSISSYIRDITAINAGYLKSKIIRTPLENDHVRFSWLVSIGVLLSVHLFLGKKDSPGFIKYLLAIISIWLVIYLHILAARTGLLCLYAMLLVTGFWLIGKKTKSHRGILLIIFLALLPVTAYYVFPTFKNRVKYFLYDFSYFKNASYLPGSNDGVRILSVKAGVYLLNETPLTGVGFGDIFSKTGEWYKTNHPGMLKSDEIYPGSEWVMYGAGCGWPGILLFTGIMLIPFFLKNLRRSLSWHLLNTSVALSFLVDIGLEVQYGVFLYSFIVLWWWKWLQTENEVIILPQ